MFTTKDIKNYEVEYLRVITKITHVNILNFFNRFNERFRIHMNQSFVVEKGIFSTIVYTNPQKKGHERLLKISSLWFCYEILLLICKENDSITTSSSFLIADSSKTKVEKFRQSFLAKLNSQSIINSYYINITELIDKINGKTNKIDFISKTIILLESLKKQNTEIKNKKDDYNPFINDFIEELKEIEKVIHYNYRKILKERKAYSCRYLNIKSFLGLSYVVRNHYVHNGLVPEVLPNMSHLYERFWKEISDCASHLVLDIAIGMMKEI